MVYGPRIGLFLIPTHKQELRQLLRISPPVSADLAEAATKIPRHTQREISDVILSEIGTLIAEEPADQPYSDRQILHYIHEKGYGCLRRADIAYARKLMGIESTSRRRLDSYEVFTDTIKPEDE